MTISVNIRQVVGPEDAARRDTQGLRDGFVIESLFRSGEVNLTYSHLDRMIVGGVAPVSGPLSIGTIPETGTTTFLERREAAIVNIGGPGKIRVGESEFSLDFQEALYVGLGGGHCSSPARPRTILPCFTFSVRRHTVPARPC